jgi:hypothetical protein
MGGTMKIILCRADGDVMDELVIECSTGEQEVKLALEITEMIEDVYEVDSVFSGATIDLS